MRKEITWSWHILFLFSFLLLGIGGSDKLILITAVVGMKAVGYIAPVLSVFSF